jgi:uncharacterized SAM-binding protein YcdF (DUF218 family)
MENFFFYISKIIPLLLFPLPLFLLLSIYALFAIRSLRCRIAYGIALTGFILLSTTASSDWMIRYLEDIHPSIAPDAVQSGDAVVVLTGMLMPLGRSNEGLAFENATDRILAADGLIRSGRTKLVLITGGSGLMGQGGDSEALLLQKWLKERSPQSIRILAESESRNTAENAILTARILIDKLKIKRIVLITSAFHMPRSVLCFRKAGFDVIPYPVDYRTMMETPVPEGFVPSTEALFRSTIAVKEYMGLVAYYIKGYI